MERLGMTVFGAGDLGFRVYDIFLMVAMTGAMIAIAWPYDWLAGLFAGVLFAMIHAADGPKGAGQRDAVMAMLMVVGLAFLLHSVRRQVAAWMLMGGLFFGLATAVKPTIAPLGLVLLVMAALILRKRGEGVARFVVYGVVGGAVPALFFFGFLLHYHALDAFIAMNRDVTAYYSHLYRMSYLDLLRESMPRPMRVLVPFGLAAAAMNRDWSNWERWALAVGVAFGAFSYFVQGKGYYYQRYPLVAMTLLWFAIELSIAARRRGVARAIGTAGLAIGIFGLTPMFAERARTIFYSNIFTETLETDLRQIGVAGLQHNVQCLDMVDGCMNALYHLQIVQQTGRTGDNLLFPPDANFAVVQKERQKFWDALMAHPPDVFVISDEQFMDAASFDKLKRWPEFARYLADNYELRSAHSFPITVAYRIYVRKGSFADGPGL